MPRIDADAFATAAHSATHSDDASHLDQRSFEKHVDAGYDADVEDNPSGKASSDLKQAYDHVTGFHLTSAPGKVSIQEGGFDMSKKTANSAEKALSNNVAAQKECATNHYVSMPSLQSASGTPAQERREAMRLPLVVMPYHGNSNPSVVRTLVPKHELTTDTAFEGVPQRAFMMADQPADRVLQSHGSPSAGNVREFAQLASQHLERPVSLDEARQGLIDHQSDSDEDPVKLGHR